MQPLTRRSLQRAELLAVAAVALSVAGFAAAGLAAGWQDVAAHLGRLDAGVVCGMLLLSLVNYGLRILRWRLFAVRLGVALPLGSTALYYTAGFALTTTPGRLGEALRLWLMEKGHGIAYARSAPLLIGDRVGDANAVTGLCLLGLSGFGSYAWVGLGFGLVLLAGNLLLVRPALLERAIGVGYRLSGGRWARLFAGARTALVRTGRLFAPGPFAAALLLGGLGWLAEAVAFHWVLDAMGSGIPLAQSIFIFVFSMLIGGASMLPGGLGGTEATMIGLLLAVGVPADAALAATAAIRATTLWFAVALGFPALAVALRRVGGAVRRAAA